MPDINAIKILNVDFHNLSKHEFLETLDSGFVVTPNVDHLVKLQKDEDFFKVYQEANFRVCDSQIVLYASKLLGSPLKDKISGSDLLPAFCDYHKDNQDIKIFLLGAPPGVAKQAQEVTNRKIGRNIIVGAHCPSYGFEKRPEECQEILQIIKDSGANVLAVGVGAPKQEKWIAQYKEQLPSIKIFLAVGATIEFMAGHKDRSPQWMSEMGLEWLYRLLQEPERLWRRYLVEDPYFFWLILKQQLGLYQNPMQTIYQPKHSQPIGQILQQAGLLSPEQVQTVLDFQNNFSHKLRFGEITVRHNLLNQKTIDFFINEFPHLTTQSNQGRIGDYLKSAGLLNDEQIHLILQDQEKEDLKFGELAVRRGLVHQKTINWLLDHVVSETPGYEAFPLAA